MEAAEELREKGDGIAVDRRNGFDEDDDTGGDEDGTLVCSGGSDGGWTDTGRPPGVSALAIDGPGWRVSRPPVGVEALPVRWGSCSIGVELVPVAYIVSTDDPLTWEVSDGRSVDDNVLSPAGVSRAAA